MGLRFLRCKMQKTSGDIECKGNREDYCESITKMVKIYATSWCPSCIYAKRLLSERGLEFEEINIEEKGWSRDDLFELTGGRTVPQIIIDEKPIGGYDDLLKLDSIGELAT